MTIETTITITHEEMKKMGLTDKDFHAKGFWLISVTSVVRTYKKNYWCSDKRDIEL